MDEVTDHFPSHRRGRGIAGTTRPRHVSIDY